MASPGMWQADKRLYVNRAGDKVVPENSPEAARVLVGESGEIPIADAERLGLVKVKDAVVQNVETEPTPKPEPEPEPVPEPEEKELDQSPNKARKPSGDK